MAKDFPPQRLPDGSYRVSEHQVQEVHVPTEVLSYALFAPFLLYAATRTTKLSPAARLLLAAGAIGALIVDPYLHGRFARAQDVELDELELEDEDEE